MATCIRDMQEINTNSSSSASVSLPPSLLQTADERMTGVLGQYTGLQPNTTLNSYNSSSSSSSLPLSGHAHNRNSLDFDTLFSMLLLDDKENRRVAEQQQKQQHQQDEANMAARAEQLVRWVTEDSAGAALDAAHANNQPGNTMLGAQVGST